MYERDDHAERKWGVFFVCFVCVCAVAFSCFRPARHRRTDAASLCLSSSSNTLSLSFSFSLSEVRKVSCMCKVFELTHFHPSSCHISCNLVFATLRLLEILTDLAIIVCVKGRGGRRPAEPWCFQMFGTKLGRKTLLQFFAKLETILTFSKLAVHRQRGLRRPNHERPNRNQVSSSRRGGVVGQAGPSMM